MKNALDRVRDFARGNWIGLVLGPLALLLLFLLYYFPGLRGELWSVLFVDMIMAFALLCVGYGALNRYLSVRKEKNGRSHLSPESVTLMIAVLAIFVAYASFRNQSRLATESARNAEGQTLLEFEMGNENIRCLYGNYAHDDPDACLQKLISDPNEWSTGIFYVEEALWHLEKAEEDRQEWGAIYSRDIDYWRTYVNEDPTGLFSFYLVSFYADYDSARQAMSRAGVNIVPLCQKYLKVYRALEQSGAKPDDRVDCPVPRAPIAL